MFSERKSEVSGSKKTSSSDGVSARAALTPALSHYAISEKSMGISAKSMDLGLISLAVDNLFATAESAPPETGTLA
jgi:hypothetical protein